jgi:hypothetical protein
VEYEKWWVDAVKPIPALIAYGMVLEPAFALKALAVLLTALPGMVFHPFAAGQGEPLPLEAVRTGAVDEAARRYADDPAFRRELDAALGEVLQSIGPYGILPPAGGETGRPSIRAQAMSTAGLLRALRGFRARVRRLCRAVRPAPPQPDFLEAGQRISRGFSDHLVGAAQQILRERGVSLVVFGHTHQARLDVLQGGVYANSGTWTWWRDFSQPVGRTGSDCWNIPNPSRPPTI